MNISATLNLFKLIRDPALCLPHCTVNTFDQLPIPLSKAFSNVSDEKLVDIRAVVLDKDNCFAVPRETTVYEPYKAKFQALRKAYPGSALLIVSNSAGTHSDPSGSEAELVEKSTGVKVLRHSTKVPSLLSDEDLAALLTQGQKPGCRDEVFQYFQHAGDVHITSPSQIAVVGDRLFTDVMMANMMGARGIWIRDGVVQEKGLVS